MAFLESAPAVPTNNRPKRVVVGFQVRAEPPLSPPPPLPPPLLGSEPETLSLPLEHPPRSDHGSAAAAVSGESLSGLAGLTYSEELEEDELVSLEDAQEGLDSEDELNFPPQHSHSSGETSFGPSSPPIRDSAGSASSLRSAKLVKRLGPGADRALEQHTESPCAPSPDLNAPLEDMVWRKLYIASDLAAKNASMAVAERPLNRRLSLVCQHGLRVGCCSESECVQVVSASITDVQKRPDGVFEFCLAVVIRPLLRGEPCDDLGCVNTAVWHRYNAFYRLNKLLVSHFGADCVPPFPGKKFNHIVPSDRVARSRVTKLNRYLGGIMKSGQLLQADEFKCFISTDHNARSIFYRSQK